MPPHRHLPFLRQSWVEQQYPARRPQYPPSDESIPRAIFQGSQCSNDTSLRTQHVPPMPEQVVLSHAELAHHLVTYHPPHWPHLLQILSRICLSCGHLPTAPRPQTAIVTNIELIGDTDFAVISDKKKLLWIWRRRKKLSLSNLFIHEKEFSFACNTICTTDLSTCLS